MSAATPSGASATPRAPRRRQRPSPRAAPGRLPPTGICRRRRRGAVRHRRGCLRAEISALERQLDQARPLLVVGQVFDPELAVERAQVRLHRVDAEEDLLGDLLIRRRGRVPVPVARGRQSAARMRSWVSVSGTVGASAAPPASCAESWSEESPTIFFSPGQTPTELFVPLEVEMRNGRYILAVGLFACGRPRRRARRRGLQGARAPGRPTTLRARAGRQRPLPQRRQAQRHADHRLPAQAGR